MKINPMLEGVWPTRMWRELEEELLLLLRGTRGTTKIPNVPLSYVLYMRYAKVQLGEHARGYRYKYESAPLAYPPLCTHYVRKGTLRGTQGVGM